MPIHRTTARVLPVNQDGEVLLLQDRDPARPESRRWASIGGGVDAGESPEEAAVRELHEETTISADIGELEGPIGRHAADYSYDGVAYRADCTYFALSLVREVEISFANLETDEIGNVFAARWWRPQEMESQPFVEPDLPDIMRRAIDATATVVEEGAPRPSRNLRSDAEEAHD